MVFVYSEDSTEPLGVSSKFIQRFLGIFPSPPMLSDPILLRAEALMHRHLYGSCCKNNT